MCLLFVVAQAKGKKQLFVQLVLDNIWSLYDAVVTNRSVKCMCKCATYTFTLLTPVWWISDQRQGEGGKDCVVTWTEGDGQRLKPLWPQGASLCHLSSVVAFVFSCSLYPLSEVFQWFLYKEEEKKKKIICLPISIFKRQAALCIHCVIFLNTALAMVCEKLPSPLEMTSERAEKLLRLGTRQFNSLPEKTQELKNGTFPQTQHTQRCER